MARVSLVCQAVVLALTVPLYGNLGLSFEWGTIAPHALLIALLVGIWTHHQLVPDRRQGAVVNDLMIAVALMLLLTNISSPAQYAAVRLGQPLIDHWLAAADGALGVHVPSLVSWTRAHPTIDVLLKVCYFSLLPQFLFAPIAAGLIFRDRDRLWEYFFHFHFCLLVTLASLAIFPAACAFTYYGFESTIDQSRFIHQFEALRDGSFGTLRFDDLEGLISMPSFHTAGAMMVTWMFRGRRWWLVPVAVLNVGLVASTVLTGAHYFIDVIATGVVFLTSLVAFRLFGRRWMPADQEAPTSSSFGVKR